MIRNVSPTLIIGLGGTGARVLKRIKELFNNQLPPVVKILEIDADQSVQSDFDPGEFMYIGINEQVRKIIYDFFFAKSYSKLK